MTVRLREVRDEPGFAALSGDWSDLHGRAANANVFLSHEWLHAWWLAYRPRAALRIVVAEVDGRLAGVAPLMVATEWRHALPTRVLRFIGDGTFETDHISFVVDRILGAEVVPRLLDAIHRMPWDVAEFNQIPEDGSCTAPLLEFARANWRHNCVVTPSLRRVVPASFDALLSSIPPRMRTALRSSRRRLEENHRIEFGLHLDEDELPAALDALFANHASRWRAKGQSGVFQDPRKRVFYQDLSRRLLKRGWLRFYFLKLDGKIVAQEFCFEHDGVVMLLQEGFDYDLAKLNIGNTLRGMVFEHLISQGLRIYDFLPGESRHKRAWSDNIVNDLRITCARRTLRGEYQFLAPRFVASVRNRLRPWRDRLRSLRPDASQETE